MNRAPVCTPCMNETCCTGQNQASLPPTVHPHDLRWHGTNESNSPLLLWPSDPSALGQDGFKTTVINSTKYPEKALFGVPIGRQYGFCFIPIPSVPVPNNKSSFTTRCLPFPSGAGVGSGSADDFKTALKSFDSGPNASSLSTSATSSALTGATTVVGNALGNPQQVFASLCDEILQNKYVIIGSAGIALRKQPSSPGPSSSCRSLHRHRTASSGGARESARRLMAHHSSHLIRVICSVILTAPGLFLSLPPPPTVIALLYTQILRFAAGFTVFFVIIALWCVLAASTVLLAFKAAVINPSQIPIASVAVRLAPKQASTLGQTTPSVHPTCLGQAYF